MEITKHIYIILLFCFITDGLLAGASGNIGANTKEQELTIRNGLPNFFKKVDRGDSIKVAYLGGSITAQPGWRVYSLNWLQQRYPKSTFKEINAAIGGTGSRFGVYRLRQQVLDFNPDLIFVEFAVNDDGADRISVVRSIEGIVRQVWEKNPHCDICFVYTITKNFFETELNGQLPASVIFMEEVAERYKIPSVNFGFEVCRQVKENELVYMDKSAREVNGIPVFSPDGTHPYVETGHHLYLKVLSRFFQKIDSKVKAKEVKHSLPKLIVKDCVLKAKMLDFKEVNMVGDWEIFRNDPNSPVPKFSKFLPEIAKANQNVESLEIRFTGKAIGFYDVVGPDVGRVIVEIDGVVRDTIYRFDRYCTYYRMNYFLIDHLADKLHDVTFRVLADPFDKGAILKEEGNYIANPDDFISYNWYLGKILIDGDLIR